MAADIGDEIILGHALNKVHSFRAVWKPSSSSYEGERSVVDKGLVQCSVDRNKSLHQLPLESDAIVVL